MGGGVVGTRQTALNTMIKMVLHTLQRGTRPSLKLVTSGSNPDRPNSLDKNEKVCYNKSYIKIIQGESMKISTMRIENGAGISANVESIAIEANNGKEFELKQNKDTGEIYLLCNCGDFFLEKKTANMIYIKVK